MSGDLDECLLSRIAEDEAAVARMEDAPMNGVESPAEADYLRFADRAPSECEAKRRIVERCVFIQKINWWEYDDAPNLANDVLEALALSYADHPDYRPEWRP